MSSTQGSGSEQPTQRVVVLPMKLSGDVVCILLRIIAGDGASLLLAGYDETGDWQNSRVSISAVVASGDICWQKARVSMYDTVGSGDAWQQARTVSHSSSHDMVLIGAGTGQGRGGARVGHSSEARVRLVSVGDHIPAGDGDRGQFGL